MPPGAPDTHLTLKHGLESAVAKAEIVLKYRAVSRGVYLAVAVPEGREMVVRTGDTTLFAMVVGDVVGVVAERISSLGD